jgi:DNA polymerase-3 subunit epsilon
VDLLRGVGDRFVVIDVETTGLLNSDRIVEVAAVTLSPNGQVVDEWDTLVNPGRDVGPTHIHRITASMVSMAPTFDEVAVALAERLHGAVLVAHNLPFDARMLANEFGRAGEPFDQGRGVCTLQVTGQKLTHACERYGIDLDGHHRALADARATSRLLRKVSGAGGGSAISPAEVSPTTLQFNPRTLRRDTADEESVEMPYLSRMADRAHHISEHGATLVYMDLLDWALADLVLTETEKAQLFTLAQDLGLSATDIDDVHNRYIDELVAAALRDGTVDQSEQAILEACADVLGADTARIESMISGRQSETGTYQLKPGTKVCFTGAATYPDGKELPRKVLEAAASGWNLTSVKGVTKKGCDLVVASDPASQSGKARKARDYGIPVASVRDFLNTQPNGNLPVFGTHT